MALVLINPAAGGGRAGALAGGVRGWLREHHPDVRCEVPASAPAATDVLRNAATGERVVVIGGDGSLHRLLEPLVQGRHEVGLVPVGSGNDGARALGLARLPWPQALAHALRAPARAADVGHVETATEARLFFSSLAAGFDAAVAARAVAAPAALRGLPRYLLATLQEVAVLQVQPLKIAVDGELWHEGPALFASTLNTPSYGSGMPAVPHARVDDGRLDLVLAGRFGRLGVLGMLPRLLAGRHLSHPRVRVADAAEVVIEASSALPVAADGEPMRACTRLCVRVVPGALRVVGR